MYIIVEIQKTGDQVATLVNTAATINQAESVYHQILAAAAISQVPLHSAILMTDAGTPLRYESYSHEVQAAE